jgi:hypothetical protein
MLKKRGYFFIVDSIIALTVLSIGIILLFSYNQYVPPTADLYTVSDEVINVLYYNVIEDMNNDYIRYTLMYDGNITDTHKTIIEQIGEFYYRNQTKNCEYCMDLINNTIYSVLKNMFPSDYNYIVIFDNITIYDNLNTGVERVSIENASLVMPSKAMVHGLYNKTELYGPYIVEVLSWV